MSRPMIGVLVAAAFIVVIGLAVWWLARTGPRLSRSGRDMKDYRKW